MSYSKEFQELLDNQQWKSGKHYIGLGNPNANILIVGKECAYDKDCDGYKYEFLHNFDKWQEFDSSRCIDDVKSWVDNEKLDWGIFDPLAPYKGQRFTFGKSKGTTSRTWYKYQKLINKIRDLGKSDVPKNESNIDFYRDCFITELSELCRTNNKNLPAAEKHATELSIRNRFDLMMATRFFWSHFETVILACGPYADALRKDFKLTHSIFGYANVISTVPIGEGKTRKIPQLSNRISDDLLAEIAKQV